MDDLAHLPPGAHVHFPEVDWPAAPTMAFQHLVEKRQEPPRFAAGQLWRTRCGQLRRITHVGESCMVSTPVGSEIDPSLVFDRFHSADGTHPSLAKFDLVKRINAIPPRPFTWSWPATFWTLVGIGLAALAYAWETRL